MGIILEEMKNTLDELTRMHSLNIEFLDVLHVTLKTVLDYAYKHDIPIKEEKALKLLLRRGGNLLEEITSKNSLSPFIIKSNESLQGDKPNNDFTVPVNGRPIYACRGTENALRYTGLGLSPRVTKRIVGLERLARPSLSMWGASAAEWTEGPSRNSRSGWV